MRMEMSVLSRAECHVWTRLTLVRFQLIVPEYYDDTERARTRIPHRPPGFDACSTPQRFASGGRF